MTDVPTIYSPGPGCPGCGFTERAFLGRDVRPDVVPVDSDAGQAAVAAAIARLPEGSRIQAPVVTYRGMIWSGVRPDLIEEAVADIRQRQQERDASAKAYSTPRAAA